MSHPVYLIFCYKIINGLVSLDPADFFVFRDSKTRGHKYKLVVQHSRVDARQHFFAIELFQCGILYLNMLYFHLLLVCSEAA